MDSVPPLGSRRHPYRQPILTHRCATSRPNKAMPHENQSRETTFGYLSTVHTAEDGYFGGYLIISAIGRPLEFHCTSPVRPSRAQEILYGPTLQPYLMGEQIGAAVGEFPARICQGELIGQLLQ